MKPQFLSPDKSSHTDTLSFPTKTSYPGEWWTENSTVIEGDSEVSLRSSSQQPPGIFVKHDRPLP